MSMIERAVVGQTFRVVMGPSGRMYSWRIMSPPQWSKIGERFVWCESTSKRVRAWRPRVFRIQDIPPPLGPDLVDFYSTNPHLPEGKP